MDWYSRHNITEFDFIYICKSSHSMAHACSRLNMQFTTFKRHAIKLGVYNTNQGGKGAKKIQPTTDVYDILSGKRPDFQTYKLKQKLLACGIKQNICEICHISEWNGSPLNMELDHIDGNNTNHKLNNLRMLCPNCHAQTPTYRSKKRK